MITFGLLLLTQLTLEEFGGFPNDGCDDLPALEAAKAVLSTSSQSEGGQIQFDCGVYDFSDTIVIDRTMRLSGRTGPNFNCTTLKWENTSGLLITGTATKSYENANGTVIEYLELEGSYGDGTDHGIIMEVDAEVSHVRVEKFGGNCIHVSADIHRDPPSNASLFLVEESRMVNCGGYGLYIRGGDTNAGKVKGNDFRANFTGEVFAGSFIGDIFEGNHFNGNGGISGTKASARNVFLGNYAEGSTPIEINHPSIYVHALGAGVFSGSGYFERDNRSMGSAKNYQNLDDLTEIRVGNVSPGAGYGVEEWDAIDGLGRIRDPKEIRLGYEPGTSSVFNGWWCRYEGNTSGKSFLCYATNKVEGPAERMGQLWFRGEGYWVGGATALGSGNGLQRVFVGVTTTSTPTRSDLPAGSFLRNTNPTEPDKNVMGWLFNGSSWVPK